MHVDRATIEKKQFPGVTLHGLQMEKRFFRIQQPPELIHNSMFAGFHSGEIDNLIFF